MLYSHPQGHVFYRTMNHARPKIAYGKGIYLYDDSGKRYIDGSGGPLVVNVGHGRSEIVDAMTRQAAEAAYVHAIIFTSDVLEQYADALAGVVPIPEARFYFLSSGSEVVEGAIKLARQIQIARGEHGRHLVISRSPSYHGMTLGALAVSGRPGMRTPYLDMLHDVPHIPTPYTYRHPMSGEALAGRLEEIIQAQGPENVAGFIAEPISGATLGAAVPPDDYWPRIREICDRYGVLLIADEVLVGFGRTGTMWGLEHWGVVPDILTVAKGINSGYVPLGATVVNERIERAWQKKHAFAGLFHGYTYSGHALACAAALANLKIVADENLPANAGEVGSYFMGRLAKLMDRHEIIGDVRGKGLMMAIELVKNRKSKAGFAPDDPIHRKLAHGARARGAVIRANAGKIIISPPLIFTKADADTATAIFDDLIGDVAKGALA